MRERASMPDAALVACDACMKEIPRSEAFVPEGIDQVAHFCGVDCYEDWRNRLAAEDDPHDPPAARAKPATAPAAAQPQEQAQEGQHDHGPARDERIKRVIRRHPQRDEPRLEGVEPWELPPR
ncbi:MAG TPA: DUF3330 domain-containing protein [Usitatibacter sp.]|nr:DUF3330 domain-containing protein [Usitatibacter sp.]